MYSAAIDLPIDVFVEPRAEWAIGSAGQENHIMRADKFKKWLENKGCRFDQHEKERGDGNASLMVKLGDKRSVLPFIGTNKNIGSENMDRILQELGLDGADVPDHVEGEKAKQEERHDRLPDRKAKAAASAAKKSKA